MIVLLEDGTRVECEDEPFDSGAKGTVHFTSDGRSVIKFYESPESDLSGRLEQVIHHYNCAGSDPYWLSLFAWPNALVRSPRLGIRMPAVKGKKKLAWIVNLRAFETLPTDCKNWTSRLLTALRIARAVRRMHTSGLAHGDLSPNNIFVNPVDGSVAIIDLDSVVVPGFLPPQVDGTPEYIAPEILERRAPPSIETDCHALAVILHQLLLYYHPLKAGPKRYSQDDEEDARMQLGSRAIFIDHPTDASNRPRKYFSTVLLGEGIRELFRKALVDGLASPRLRPTAGKWEDALVRLHDRVVTCVNPACVARTFPVSETRGLHCPWCATAVPTGTGMPLLRFYASRTSAGDYTPDRDFYFMGFNGKTLHQWHAHVGVTPKPGNETPVARIEQQGPRWVLVNLALPDLRVVEGGAAKPLPPGSKVDMQDQLKLVLGNPPRSRAVVIQMVT